MNRRVAAVVSLGLVAATLEPLARAPRDDGFPLSTFPMFATPRSTRITMSYARGVTRDGTLRALSPSHLGTREVMQAFATVQRAVAAGPRAAAVLCSAIAARVAVDAGLGDVIAIRLVSGTHDAVAYLARGAAISAEAPEVTRASCDVARGAAPEARR